VERQSVKRGDAFESARSNAPTLRRSDAG